MAATFETVDAYIASFPPDVQVALEAVRQAIRTAIPGTQELISYGIPAFSLDGRGVVWFAGWRRHISVYPIPAGGDDLDAEMAPYKAARGTLRFQLSRPMPFAVIEKVAARLLQQRLDGVR